MTCSRVQRAPSNRVPLHGAAFGRVFRRHKCKVCVRMTACVCTSLLQGLRALGCEREIHGQAWPSILSARQSCPVWLNDLMTAGCGAVMCYFVGVCFLCKPMQRDWSEMPHHRSIFKFRSASTIGVRALTYAAQAYHHTAASFDVWPLGLYIRMHCGRKLWNARQPISCQLSCGAIF